MTISGRSGFRLSLKSFSIANILFALFWFINKKPSFSTPLFEFSLLAVLHALLLGSLIPLLLDRFYQDSRAFRIGALFLCVGALVIVVGFLIHPRSPLPSEGGILAAIGIMIFVFLFRSLAWSWIYWLSLAGSSFMGIYLGRVLLRPVIDPIPFSTIAVHGLLGMALGLFPLFWVRSERRSLSLFLMIPLIGTTLGLLAWILLHTLITWTIWLLFIGIVIFSGVGITRLGKLVGFLCLTTVGIVASAGWLFPGEWISLLGFLLLGGCYVGYFRKGGYSSGAAGSE